MYKLRRPITLSEMKEVYGFKAAPRGFVYLPLAISRDVDWRGQELVSWSLFLLVCLYTNVRQILGQKE